MKGIRTLSHSEITTALTCQARHAFAYTGHLTDGDTLKKRELAANLSNGRAWGAAVACWHATGDRWAAQKALFQSYAQDAQEQIERGVLLDPTVLVEESHRVAEILDHHMATVKRLSNLTRLEDDIEVAIPSKTGRRGSNRYRFQAKIDGFTQDARGYEWVVEYKLYGQMTPLAILELSRQLLWYAWSRQRESGVPVVGVIFDQTLNVAPKPARIVQGSKKGTFTVSHAKDQITTPEIYRAACQEFGVAPHMDTEEALAARVWHQRFEVLFRPGELEEAGRELVSAAQTIQELDSGKRYPVRNGQAHICKGCRYNRICANPGDELFVDTLFERTVPKRLRGELDAGSSPGARAEAVERHNDTSTTASEPGIAWRPSPGVSTGSHELASNSPQED